LLPYIHDFYLHFKQTRALIKVKKQQQIVQLFRKVTGRKGQTSMVDFHDVILKSMRSGLIIKKIPTLSYRDPPFSILINF
jgi:hypothetical protein